MNLHPDYLLNDINEPQDLKQLNLTQLQQLATEMRQLVLGAGQCNWWSRRAKSGHYGSHPGFSLRV